MSQQQKSKRSSLLANVPIHRRNSEEEENDKRTYYNRSDIQVEPSSSSGYRNSYRRPNSISSIHNLTNRYSRNSFIGDDSVDYVSFFKREEEQGC